MEHPTVLTVIIMFYYVLMFILVIIIIILIVTTDPCNHSSSQFQILIKPSVPYTTAITFHTNLKISCFSSKRTRFNLLCPLHTCRQKIEKVKQKCHKTFIQNYTEWNLWEKDTLGPAIFVPCSEAVMFSEVKNVLASYKSWRYGKCPL